MLASSGEGSNDFHETDEDRDRDQRDLQRILQISDAVQFTGKSSDEGVCLLRKELRGFVRKCLEQLPAVIDKTDPRNSHFQGTYIDKHKITKCFDYNAFVALVSHHIRTWLTRDVDELPHPHHANVHFTVLSSQGKHLAPS